MCQCWQSVHAAAEDSKLLPALLDRYVQREHEWQHCRLLQKILDPVDREHWVHAEWCKQSRWQADEGKWSYQAHNQWCLQRDSMLVRQQLVAGPVEHQDVQRELTGWSQHVCLRLVQPQYDVVKSTHVQQVDGDQYWVVVDESLQSNMVWMSRCGRTMCPWDARAKSHSQHSDEDACLERTCGGVDDLSTMSERTQQVLHQHVRLFQNRERGAKHPEPIYASDWELVALGSVEWMQWLLGQDALLLVRRNVWPVLGVLTKHDLVHVYHVMMPRQNDHNLEHKGKQLLPVTLLRNFERKSRRNCKLISKRRGQIIMLNDRNLQMIPKSDDIACVRHPFVTAERHFITLVKTIAW